MKVIIPVVVAYLAGSLPVCAQNKIKTDESNENIGGGRHNAIVVAIYDADDDMVEKEWKNELKSFGPQKTSTKSGEIFGDDATLSSISSNAFDIYARAEKKSDNEVKFIVAFDLGGAFLSSSQHGGSFRTAERKVYDFAVRVTRMGLQEKIREGQKELEKRQRRMEQLIREKERLNQDIEKYKTQIMQAEGNITRAQEEIKENDKTQEEAKQKVAEQENAVKELEEREKKVE